MLQEELEIVAIHGEKLNAHYPGIGHALPLSIPADLDDPVGTIVFKYTSDGMRFNRHVPLDILGDYKIGQKLMQVIS